MLLDKLKMDCTYFNHYFLLIATYLVISLACLCSSYINKQFFVFSFANPFAIAMLLRHQKMSSPGLILAFSLISCLVNYIHENVLYSSIALSLGDTLSVVAAVFLLKKYELYNHFDHDVQSATYFLGISAIVSPLIGGALQALLLSPAYFIEFWISSYVAHALGIFLWLPFCLLLTKKNLKEHATIYKVLKYLVFIGITLFTTYVSLSYFPVPFVFILLPLLAIAIKSDPFISSLTNIFCVLFMLILIGYQQYNTILFALFRDSPLTYLSLLALLTSPFFLSVVMRSMRYEREQFYASETKFREAMEFSAIGMALVSLEGFFLKVNKAFCDMLGYTSEEIVKLTFQDITHPDDLEKDLQLAEKLYAQEISSYHLEKRYFKKNGEVIWVLLTGSLVRNPEGIPQYCIAQIKDINEKRFAEEKLKQSEERLNFALTCSGQGVLDWSIPEDIATVSRQWQELTLINQNRISSVKDSLLMLVHPKDVLSVKRQLEEHLAGEKDYYHTEHRLSLSNNKEIWVLVRGQVIERAIDHTPLRMICTFEDISQRKRAELEQKIQAERTALATEAGHVGIWVWNVQTDELIWDKRMYELYGLSEFEGRPYYEIWENAVFPEDRERARYELQNAVQNNKRFDTEFRITRPNGEVRYIRAMANAIRDIETNVFYMIGTNWDVTEIRQLNEVLYEEKERLHVTLNSIADGVITTDAKGKIQFMNPIAQTMTEHRLAEVQGRDHEEVLVMIDINTDKAIESPVKLCLQKGQIFYSNIEAVLISKSGVRFDIQSSAAPVKTPDGQIIGVVLVFQNISKARMLQRKLNYNATHDALTGLFNRSKFEQELQKAVEDAKANQSVHALCFLDFDRFKIVNDSAGHIAGDKLLVGLSALMQSEIRTAGIIARVGGDEFGMLLYNCSVQHAQKLCNHLISKINAFRFQWEGRIYDVGLSIGIAEVGKNATSVSLLMSHADIACYTSKRAGRNCSSIYQIEQKDFQRQHQEVLFASGLRQALENNNFKLFAQRIVPLNYQKKEAIHYELLLRMLDSQGNLIAPGNFIPAAERFNLMSQIDWWVIQELLINKAEDLAKMKNVKFGINISANSLNNANFLPYLLNLIDQSSLIPEQLYFELTETALVNHFASASNTINILRDKGCQVALDDFGIGLSSFNYLKNFQVDIIKIDGNFIRNVHESQIDAAIVESINQIAHRLGASTVGEFVECQEILNTIRHMGVDYAQGYAVHKPEALEQILEDTRVL